MEQLALEDLITQLDGQPNEAAKKDLLLRRRQWISMETVRELDEAVRAALRVDVQRALRMADMALLIAVELEADEAMALAHRAKANALWFRGECKEAVELFQQAAELFERIGNMQEVARTLSSSIQSRLLLGEYESAFGAANRAREIFARLGESARMARVDINVANIYHRQNQFAEALAAYDRAYQQLLPHRDTEGIGVALHNMAVCLIALDNFAEALETYERLRQFCQQHDMPLLAAQADYNIAYLHYLRGDYTRALELLRSTRESCRRNGDTYHLGLCDLDQSEIYLELNLVEEAAEMAQASFDHFDQLGMGFESVRALTNLAIAVSIKGDAARSLDLFGQAQDIARHENNRTWPKLIELYRAFVLFEEGEWSAAQELCLSAAEFFGSADLPSKQALCLLLSTRICLQNGRVREADRYCTEALHLLKKVDAPILYYQAQLLSGQILEASHEPKLAYGAYQEARGALETLRSSLQLQELKIGLMQNRQEVYSRLVQLCLDSERGEASVEEAFLYVEAAKSRTLRDLILGRAQPSQPGSEENESDRTVSNVRKELNWYYRRIEREELSEDGGSREHIERLQRQAQSREHQLLRLLLDSPDKASVGTALRNTSAASLAEIRAVLGPAAGLLEYFAIGDRVHVAVVTAERLKIVPLGMLAPLEQRLRMLQFQFSKFRLGREYLLRFEDTLLQATQAHLRSLYEDLVQPVKDLLDVRDLVIVPFGALHSLPFHALLNGEDYLVDKYSICYQPSASIFAHIHRKHVAETDAASTQTNLPALILGVGDSGTPFIAEEVKAVAEVIAGARVLVGQDATEQVLRTYGPVSSLVHIASHGYFRQDSPMFSSIRLADSHLNLLDLYHMNLPVRLLTLSGCVTGLNAVAGGDELLGLTRGLLYSGAQSLLLSLWEVDDQSTAEFMKHFYQRFMSGARKADALRETMLEHRERYPHPYYWAPFKLIGDALA